jgi:hypothetical protein
VKPYPPQACALRAVSSRQLRSEGFKGGQDFGEIGTQACGLL